MDQDRYTIILQFDPKDKTIFQKVFNNLSQLDPNLTPRLKGLMASGKLIIKRDANLATARRILDSMGNTGAICGLKKQPPRPAPSTAPASQSPTNGDPVNGELSMMCCPNCSFEQLPAKECLACGIIISKARPRQQTQQLETALPGNETKDRKPKTGPSFPMTAFADLRLRIIPKIWAWLKAQPVRTIRLPKWTQRMGDALLRCGVIFVIALIFEIGLLYLSSFFWHLYIWTTVGQYYVKHFADKAKALQSLVQTDPLVLGWEITVLSLFVCLAVACVARFFHLIRYFYDSQGFPGKLIIWFLPTIALTAWAQILRDPMIDYTIASILVIVPTICMLSGCLHLAQVLLPELGGIIKLLTRAWGIRNQAFSLTRDKIKIWLDEAKRIE